MKRLFLLSFFVIFGTLLGFAQPKASEHPSSFSLETWVEAQQNVADRIIQAALADSAAYQRLAELCDTFGPRFSGSQNLEDALDWVLDEMRADGLENIRGEPVMVPHWVRGEESLAMVHPRPHDMPMLGLGGSIGTPPAGITADVLVVNNFADLQDRKDEARGKIVVFNVPFTNYGQTVQYRTQGAIAAGAVGAAASLIRSVGPFGMQTPHTGGMRYDDNVPQIPHAAITMEDADMLKRFQDRGQTVRLTLKMGAQTLPDAESRNVVAEIRGAVEPEKVVVIGGHIDSWDVGQGAMDDGGGSVVAWEALRIIKALGLRPRRTLRVVLWTNEENGLRGANNYFETHREDVDNHVLAIESDAGVFKPQGFGFSGSDAAFEMVQTVAKSLDKIEAGYIRRGGGGADIGPLMRAGVPGMGLVVDGSRYFWYHHTHADTVDKLDPHGMALCTATMAVMSYLIADMPVELPRN